jgi:hypothetical protein
VTGSLQLDHEVRMLIDGELGCWVSWPTDPSRT